MPYMSEEEARRAIVEVGRRMYEQGYVVSNDGNISVRIAGEFVVVTPTGVSKGHMNPDMLVTMSLDGSTVRMGARGASSEAKMHLRVYQEDERVTAVVHAHPVYATAFAIAGIPLDEAIMSEAMLQVGAVPVAHYAKPGTYDVPESIAPFVRTHGAVLLANHGALTWGTSLTEAYSRMEVLENYARVSYIVRQLGGGRSLSAGQVEGLAEIRAKMGLSPVVMPRGASSVVNADDVLPRGDALADARAG